jgi:hypothetical protein
MIANIFAASTSQTEAALLKATKTAAALLGKAAVQAPTQARFFREVGRTIIRIDQEDNAGANHDAIRAAFEGHDIPLGFTIMLAPETALAGGPPKLGKAAVISPATKKDILARLGADPKAKVVVSLAKIAGETVARFQHYRKIALDGLSKKLKGVIAVARETVLVGESGGTAAVLGMMPHAETTTSDVETFVRSLLKFDAIDFGGDKKKKPAVAKRGMVATQPEKRGPEDVTHTIRKTGDQKMLVRVRFACRG